jgi:hypothetical protein
VYATGLSYRSYTGQAVQETVSQKFHREIKRLYQLALPQRACGCLPVVLLPLHTQPTNYLQAPPRSEEAAQAMPLVLLRSRDQRPELLFCVQEKHIRRAPRTGALSGTPVMLERGRRDAPAPDRMAFLTSRFAAGCLAFCLLLSLDLGPSYWVAEIAP